MSIQTAKAETFCTHGDPRNDLELYWSIDDTNLLPFSPNCKDCWTMELEYREKTQPKPVILKDLLEAFPTQALFEALKERNYNLQSREEITK